MLLFLSILFAPMGGNAPIINKKWQNPEHAHLGTFFVLPEKLYHSKQTI